MEERGCAGAGVGRPAPHCAAIGRNPARSTDWARRTCEAYPRARRRHLPARLRGALISFGLPLAAPLELRTPTSERARLPRPEHELRYDRSGASSIIFGLLLRCELVIEHRTCLNFLRFCDCKNCASIKMLVEDSQNSRAMMSKKYANCPLKKRPVLVREERPATPPTTPPHPAHRATTLYYDYHCKYFNY